MLKNIIYLSFFILSFSAMSSEQYIDITPKHTFPKGSIPENYIHVTLTTSDGDWLPEIKLPLGSFDQATVTVKSEAAYGSVLTGRIKSLARGGASQQAINIEQGQSLHFRFDYLGKHWVLIPNVKEFQTVTYDEVSNYGKLNLPDQVTKLYFTIDNADRVNKITLPKNPDDNAEVIIHSLSAKRQILDAKLVNQLPDSIFIRRNEFYQFVFDQQTQRWDLTGGNYYITTPNQTGAVIPNKKQRYTQYSLANGNWIGRITLPRYARHNDIVYITSSADWDSNIDPSNITSLTPITITKGEKYFFKYVAYKKGWVLQNPTNGSNANRRIPHIILDD